MATQHLVADWAVDVRVGAVREVPRNPDQVLQPKPASLRHSTMLAQTWRHCASKPVRTSPPAGMQIFPLMNSSLLAATTSTALA